MTVRAKPFLPIYSHVLYYYSKVCLQIDRKGLALAFYTKCIVFMLCVYGCACVTIMCLSTVQRTHSIQGKQTFTVTVAVNLSKRDDVRCDGIFVQNTQKQYQKTTIHGRKTPVTQQHHHNYQLGNERVKGQIHGDKNNLTPGIFKLILYPTGLQLVRGIICEFDFISRVHSL